MTTQVFTKDEIKGFVTEFTKEFTKALATATRDRRSVIAKKSDSTDDDINVIHHNPIRPDIDQNSRAADETERRDKAILHGELAREKRQKVKKIAQDPEASGEDLIKALGGDTAVTPLQLARLVKGDSASLTPMTTHHRMLQNNDDLPDEDFMFRQHVLGSNPSTQALSRYAEIGKVAKGRISASPTGNVNMDGHPIEGSNLVKMLQYLTKGASNRSPPSG